MRNYKDTIVFCMIFPTYLNKNLPLRIVINFQFFNVKQSINVPCYRNNLYAQDFV